MPKVHRANLENAPLKSMNPESRGNQRLLMQGAEGVATLDMIRYEIRTRTQGVYHLHEHTDNVMLVLSGTLEMIVDGERHILDEGDMIFIPRGVAHSSASGSDEPVRGVEIYAPVRGTDTVPVELPEHIREAAPATAG